MGVDELPWSAKKSRFLALPRGPPEWGRLLYEPDWSRRFFLNNFQAIIMPPFIFALLWVIVKDTLEGNVIPGREVFAVVFVAMIVGAALLSVYLVVLELKHMPFRVYEGGFTLERVPFASGLFRHGVLVPAERITSITLRRRGGGSDSFHSVVVSYAAEDGTAQSLEVNPDDPLTALAALARIDPGRTDDGVAALLDPGGARHEVVEDGEESTSDRNVIILLFPLMLWSFAGMFIAMPLLWTTEMVETDPISLIPVVLSLTMVLVLSAMGWYTILDAYATLFAGPDVVAGSVGLEIQLPLLARFHMRAPGVLPYDRIRRARRYLSPGSFKTGYQMLAGTGRPISISARTFRELVRLPGFHREGLELVNSAEPPRGSQRLARPNLPGVVAIVAAATVVSFLVLTLIGSLDVGGGADGGGEEPIPELTLFDKMFFFGSLLFVTGFGFIMYLRLFRKKRMEKRAEGIEVDNDSIRLPHAGAPFEEVRRSEVMAIVGRRLLTFRGYVLVVDTTKGRLLLPLYLVDELRERGYVVELPDMLERPGSMKGPVR